MSDIFMCSSPKAKKPRPQKGENLHKSMLDSQSMAKFTATANAAEDRREIKRTARRAETARLKAISLQKLEEDTLKLKTNSALSYWLFHADLKEVAVSVKQLFKPALNRTI